MTPHASSKSIHRDRIAGKLDSISLARDQEDANLIADLLLLATNHRTGKMPSLATRSIFSTFWECSERTESLRRAPGLKRYVLHLPWSEKAMVLANESSNQRVNPKIAQLPSFALPPKSLVLEHAAPLDALSAKVVQIRKENPGSSPETLVFLNNHYRLAVLTVEEARAIDGLTVDVGIRDSKGLTRTHPCRLKNEMPFWDRSRPFIRYEYATGALGRDVFDVDAMSPVACAFDLYT